MVTPSVALVLVLRKARSSYGVPYWGYPFPYGRAEWPHFSGMYFGPLLPWAVRVTEGDAQTGRDPQLRVLRDLGSFAQGQELTGCSGSVPIASAVG